MVRLATGKTEDESPESAKPSDGVADVPVMAGTHFHALDDKYRVIIPAKLRPALGERFWLLRTQRNNVGIYPYQTGLDIIRQAEERQADNPDDDLLDIAIEEITSSAELVENVADSAWRVPIPDILRLYAGLEKEVVTVGVLNHAELWDREKWVADQQNRMNQSDEIGKIRASIMRAGASGTGRKKKSEEVPAPVETTPLEIAAGNATGTDGNPGGNLGNGHIAPAASAGDGKRSKSMLSFDNIGKTGS
jgi:MraZ protein